MSEQLTIQEMTCKSILNRSRIPGTDYTINPYLGCQHGCTYCYATFMTRFSKQKRPWGTFVDIKINGIEILQKQITRSTRGLVSLSTVTDPYQAVEKKYALTRKILTELLKNHFPVSILTKSDLVIRDMDILKQFSRNQCEVGFSINTLDETVRANFESHSPPIHKRVNALKKLHEEGIRTWLFIAPILPILTEQSLSDLIRSVKDSVDYILVDKLNIKTNTWQQIYPILNQSYPKDIPKWKELLFSKEKRRAYNQHLFIKIDRICRKNRIQTQFC